MIAGLRKGLIIDEKWGKLILSGEKTLEMRSRPRKDCGVVGLIYKGTGLIYGSVYMHWSDSPLTDDECDCLRNYHMHKILDKDELRKWRHPIPLNNPVRFDKPVPSNHKRGCVTWVNL